MVTTQTNKETHCKCSQHNQIHFICSAFLFWLCCEHLQLVCCQIEESVFLIFRVFFLFAARWAFSATVYGPINLTYDKIDLSYSIHEPIGGAISQLSLRVCWVFHWRLIPRALDCHQNIFRHFLCSIFKIWTQTFKRYDTTVTGEIALMDQLEVPFLSCISNQIKSLLLSYHHSTSALVSEILMSVLQTAQKKTTTIYIWTDSAKKQQTIYIWTDSAKKLHWSIYSAPHSAKKKKKKNIPILHMDSTYLQTVQKTMCKIHIHILSTHSVL